MKIYFSTPSLLRNATPRKGNCGDFGVRKYDDGIGRFTSIDPLFEQYAGWTPYQYCRNNPVNLLDPSGYADYKTETTTYSDGVDDKLKYVVSDLAVSQNSTIFPEGGAAGPPSLNYESLKATGTFVGIADTWDKTKADIVNKIGISYLYREDASAVGLTSDNKAVYQYGGQGTIEAGKTNSDAAVKIAIDGVVSQGAISNSITYFHSHGVGLNLNPSPGDWNPMLKLHINSGVMINSKKEVKILGPTPQDQIVIPYEEFNNFMRK